MKKSVNLLPVEFRRRALLETRVRQWLIAFSICALCILMGIGVQWQRLGRQKEILESRRIQAEPYRDMEQTLVGMWDELSRLHASRSLLAEARRSTQTIKLLGLVSRSANDKLQVKSLDFKSTVVAKPKDKKNKDRKNNAADEQTDEQTELILSGIAEDNLAISQLLAGLKSGQVFDSVEVKKISEATSKASRVRSYSITCRINEATQ